MRKHHSQRFINQAVSKALNNQPETSLAATARSIGISKSTLYGWIKKSGNVKYSEKSPDDWGFEDKLRAINETSSLNQEETSSYCRKAGIYNHHIQQWKKEMSNSKDSSTKQENRDLQAENKQLKKELLRKEKALAEAAALIILQKKVRAIWEREGGED